MVGRGNGIDGDRLLGEGLGLPGVGEQLVHHALQREVLLGGVALLVQGRIVIVRGHLGQVVRMTRRAAVHEVEVRAAVEHIQVDARAELEGLAHAVGQILGIALDDVLAIAVEPAIPELHAHEWPVLAMLLVERGERLEVLLGTGAEVARGENIVLDEGAGAQATAPGAIGGEQRDVDTALEHQVADGAQVILVLAVRAVLVLDLHHDDVAAVRDLTGLEDRHELVVVRGDALEELGVVGTRAHGVVGQQPRGHAAELPLGADERRGTHDCVQAELRRLIQESAEVQAIGEVELARTGLVGVPGNIGLNRVEAHGLEVVEGMMPIARVHAEEVDRARQNGERLTIEQELICNLECAHATPCISYKAIDGGFKLLGHHCPSVGQ